MFCGLRCQKVASEQIQTIIDSRSKKGVKDPRQCNLIVRGHINIYDYEHAFKSVPSSQVNKVFYLTFLREPVARAISEYKHITEGLVAQFGPVFEYIIIYLIRNLIALWAAYLWGGLGLQFYL
jgi:hypothetical protein